MSEALTDLRFWAQVMTDSERTVLCSPENESRCKTYVDVRGLGGIITVKASPAIPDDCLYIVDENALEASLRQMTSGPIRLLP